MTQIPAENYSPKWEGDTRPKLPRAGTEREILCTTLDWHRQTFELKCQGLEPEALSRRTVSPSTMSLHGLVRHLAGNERWWFQQQFLSADVPHLYYTDDDPDQDFERLDGDPAEAFTVWREECERSREIVARSSLDQTGIVAATGEPVSLRYILVHMIAEYARHDGHADLLRESIDGRTGL